MRRRRNPNPSPDPNPNSDQTQTQTLALTLTLTLTFTRYVADSWGYVASANGLFVVIPASRNGLWGWLLGLPFDKTITIHRWMRTGLGLGLW